MANKFIRYLTDFGSGFVGGITRPKGLNGNWTHASKVFLDNNYRLSPRTKFTFHALFEMNPQALKSTAFQDQHSKEIGLLVKNADLPKFNFDSVVKNQYNRKKIIYKQINYDPVSITLHDDSGGVLNSMWALYYGYYVADRSQPDAAYGATHVRTTKTPIDNFRYGLDNDRSDPFFKSISIFTMSRRRFIGYTLINPRIKSWSHGNVSYEENATVESNMQIEYEAVRYSAGNVSYNNPKGFATLHYDKSPSPLSVAGGGVSNLVGPGGVLDGLESIFGDVGNGTTFGSGGGFLGTAIKAINTYQNFNKLDLGKEAVNILSSPGAITAAASTIGGVIGAVFPKSTSTTGTTTATQRNLTGDGP